MSFKRQLKFVLLGRPGSRSRRISRGLLRGARFNIDTATKSTRLLGFDEAEIAEWTRRLTAGAGVGVDVGANDGWYAAYYALQPNIRRVYAFEPDGRVHESFWQNLSLNGVQSKCVLSAKFVGTIDDPNSCRLDTVLGAEDQGMVMKIDVEGAELDVLKGAEQTLRRLGCRLVIETHSASLERDCEAFLQSLGYSTRIVKNGWYRAIVTERRSIAHNRWLIAAKS